MGTEVAERKRGTALAKYDREMAKYAEEAADTEQTPSGQFISVRGGALTIGGNKIKSGEVDVVVLDSVYENVYYKGKFDPDNPRSPECYSFGRKDEGMAPFEKAKDPQHATCAGCKHNEWGSSDRGKGKACKNQRRLALISAEGLDPKSALEAEVFYLRVPVTSVKAWAYYVKGLAATMKRPPFGMVTKLLVEPDKKNQVSVSFQAVEPLADKIVAAIMKRREAVREQIMFPYMGGSSEDGDAKKGGKSKAKRIGRRSFED